MVTLLFFIFYLISCFKPWLKDTFKTLSLWGVAIWTIKKITCVRFREMKRINHIQYSMDWYSIYSIVQLMFHININIGSIFNASFYIVSSLKSLITNNMYVRSGHPCIRSFVCVCDQLYHCNQMLMFIKIRGFTP